MSALRLFFNGMYYLLGENLLKVRDTGRAIDFFERSALKGNLDSDWILSCINRRSLKDSKNRSLIEVFRAEEHDGRALYCLASLMEEEEDKRRYGMLQRSADLGCSMGYSGLAYCFYKGRAVEKDYGECVRLAMLGAGNPFADFLLACCYLRGRGVEENVEEAVRLLERSARLDYNESQSTLAEHFFDEGEYVEAVRWSGKVIYSGVWSEVFVNILVSVMSEFDDGHATEHNVEVIFALGRAMFFDVYATTAWGRFANEYVKMFGQQSMQLYRNWCEAAQNTTLCFLAVCKTLRIPREVSQIIAKDVWKSREKPKTYGWFQSEGDIVRIKKRSI